MERTITITMSDMKGIMKSLIREAITEFASTLNIPVTLSDLENDNHTALLQITDLEDGGHAITINDGGHEWWRILTSYDTMVIKDMGFLNQDTTMIHDGIITIGSSSITPLTSHQSLDHLQLKIDANNKLAYTLLSGVPTKVSQFTNDSGFTSYSDADVIAKLKADGLLTNDNKLVYSKLDNAPNSLPASDVYSWAKAVSKPTYTASEVGARPDNWMPTASDVGARPSTWMPSASDVGARPNT